MCEELLNDFDESGLDPMRTVVRCATKEEAYTFLRYLNAKGVWNKKEIESLICDWYQYGSSTCYHLSEPRWCNVTWYERSYRIVDFCHIHKKSKEKMGSTFSFDAFMQGV